MISILINTKIIHIIFHYFAVKYEIYFILFYNKHVFYIFIYCISKIKGNKIYYS